MPGGYVSALLTLESQGQTLRAGEVFVHFPMSTLGVDRVKVIDVLAFLAPAAFYPSYGVVEDLCQRETLTPTDEQ